MILPSVLFPAITYAWEFISYLLTVKCHYIVDDNMCQNIVDLK
jgi:hypothetical protein